MSSKKPIKVVRGTYCGVIDQRLVVATCPLPRGACMWKHRTSGVCCYTDDDLTVAQFCAAVALDTPPAEAVNKARQQLQDLLKAELAA